MSVEGRVRLLANQACRFRTVAAGLGLDMDEVMKKAA